ncbi:protein ASPARTIC PROTEASE IN GUARD CELL 1 [Sorghum bicolor]|jgi:hypothetical protein|uniref:Peptidase A1 domain-containing protein n=1 Tax=Sorghum bicolor TaxID=4558 RepID=A0A1B6PAS7_SORBI|nr:protein ASPARTIC PROTEASE IN GUARD CELL 1 [Sorghum bicolor]KXG22731.1 hypothetical protein SORBI_3009G259600 [Sorghum bicolor]|eukprot:XP_021302560.1 protein ASPARTIC PROTEASE IN GUARD CELL 1 [Sorghum bicolor]
MPGRSVVSILLLVLHGLLCLQLLVALPEMEMEDGRVMEEGSCMHFSVSPPPAPPEDAEERREYFRAMAAKDLFRHEQLIAMMGSGDDRRRNGSSSSSRRRQAKEESSSSSSSKVPKLMSTTSTFELPMRSALNTAHVGMYLVSVRFGTPALPYNLVLDTANDLTWINCRLRRRKGKHYGRQSSKTMSVGGDDDVVAALAKKEARKNWYRPAKSSSWRRIRCSEQQCAHLPYNTCQSPSKLESCSYYQKTQDGTVTIGIYGNEKATVTVSDGRMAKLPGLVLGCSVLEAGASVDAHDGVLSLGNGHMSFAIHAVLRFGGRFSFCLLSANSSRDASSYLTFGPNPAVMGPGTMETEILYNVDVKAAYGPRVTAVLVGGERLDIPDDVWNIDKGLGSGVILDTSTSVTSLVPEAYEPLVAALDRHLAHLPRESFAGFEYCYRWTFTGDGVDPAHNVTIPKVTVEMTGGARLEPEAKSVVMPEVGHGVACLAFRKLPWGGGPCIIGNVLMQEYIWEIDHSKATFRFRKDKCNTRHLHTSTGGEVTNNGSSGGNNQQANGGTSSDAPSSSSTVVHSVN